MDLLRTSLLAKKKKINCLPKMISFTRTLSEVRIIVNSFPECLSENLDDDQLIEINADMIVKSLVTAAIELGEKKLIVRGI